MVLATSIGSGFHLLLLLFLEGLPFGGEVELCACVVEEVFVTAEVVACACEVAVALVLSSFGGAVDVVDVEAFGFVVDGFLFSSFNPGHSPTFVKSLA